MMLRAAAFLCAALAFHGGGAREPFMGNAVGSASTVDAAALRALLKIRAAPEPLNLDLAAIRAERARTKLGQLNPELLADRKNPRLNHRAGEYLREMGSPTAREYARRAVDALLETEKAKPLDTDQRSLLVESLIDAAEFDEADKRLEAGPFGEAEKLLLKGENAIFRVWEAAGIALDPPSTDRMLKLSLASLRRQEEAGGWKAKLESAAKDLKRSVQLTPKEARPHRSLAVALIGGAYVESARLWRTEQKTAPLMPVEAFAHLKEAANLTPEDVVAQWEAYEARIAMERDKGASSAENLPKDAVKYIATLAARLRAIASGDHPSKALAAETLAVILVQTHKPEEALKWMEAARSISQNPRLELIYFRLLVALGRLGAASPIGEGLLTSVNLPSVAAELAAVYDGLGNPDKADTLVTTWLTRWPQSLDLRLARAIILLRTPGGTNLTEAGDILDKLAADSADTSLVGELNFVRAIYLGLIGDADGAKRILDQLSATMPTRVDQVRKALSGLTHPWA